MALTIPIAHDFICPWCWVGLLQVRKLRSEFDLNFEWRGYELFPDELEWPDFQSAPPIPNKPPTPTRFEFICLADGITMPTATRPSKMRTHNAHETVEFAKTVGVADQVVEELYTALWERGENINDPEVIAQLTKGLIEDQAGLLSAIETRRFKHNIIGFDDPAYASGVFNVPTFYIEGERYAEQPYSVLRKAISAVV